MKLNELLASKKCFKLVCGAGNEDAIEIEKLVALYAKAGVKFFDLCAKEEIVDAAYRGLNRVIAPDEIHNYHFCVSVGIKGDPHVSKALIDNDKCVSCSICLDDCPQNAISNNDKFIVNKVRCIGCGKCIETCPSKAITSYSENKPLEIVIPPLVKKGLSAIELHALGTNEQEVEEKWEILNNSFDGLLSVCIDRSKLGNIQLIDRVKRLISNRKPYTTIVQADGAPMSGSDDTYKTTLQTVATAEIVQNAELPVYILLSGGTNSKTTEFAKQCEINANGVAIGSFARKIVREQIDREDFLENQAVFEKALEKALWLVNESLKYLG
ncbi:MAG: LdpA C-terminal domain-containing domain [bacterium]